MLLTRAFRQWRRVDARPWQGAGQLLAPVRDVAGRAEAIDHPQRGVADVGELMEDAGWNVDRLSARDGLALLAEAHLARPFDDEIDLLLVLVMPRHLPTARVE